MFLSSVLGDCEAAGPVSKLAGIGNTCQGSSAQGTLKGWLCLSCAPPSALGGGLEGGIWELNLHQQREGAGVLPLCSPLGAQKGGKRESGRTGGSWRF